MKKLLISLLAFTLIACSDNIEKNDTKTAPSKEEKKVENTFELPVFDNLGKLKTEIIKKDKCTGSAPTWVFSSGIGGGIVTYAEMGAAGLNFAKNEAVAKARQIAAQYLIERSEKAIVEINKTVEKIYSESGKVIISEQYMTQVVLKGLRSSDIWLSPCDRVYMKMIITEDYKPALIEAVYTEAKQYYSQKTITEMTSDKVIEKIIESIPKITQN